VPRTYLTDIAKEKTLRVTWSEEFKIGQVANEEQLVDVTERPTTGFPFDSLVLDETNSFKILGGEQITLTEDEVSLCTNFVGTFSFPEVLVPMVDDLGVYVGLFTLSQRQADWQIVDSPAPDTGYVWRDGGWRRVTLVVFGDGTYAGRPESLMGDLALVYTESDIFPNPVRATDKWNFVKGCWYDSRDLNKSINEAVLELRNLYEALNIRAAGEYTTKYEMATWRIQHEEATTWLADNDTPTPFINALNETRTDGLAKAELVAKILVKVNAWKGISARLLGEQQNLERRVRACVSLTILDELREKEIATLV